MPLRPLIASALAVLALASWTAARAEILILDTGQSTTHFEHSNDKGYAAFGTVHDGEHFVNRPFWPGESAKHLPNGVKLIAQVGKDKVNYVKEIHTLSKKDVPYLLMQKDGNLCVYSDRPGHNGLIWQTNTKGKGCKLYLQDDGYLTIRDEKEKFIWHAAKVPPGSRM